MPRDCFALAVGVGCKDDFICLVCKTPELMNDFYLAGYHLVVGDEAAGDVYRFFV